MTQYAFVFDANKCSGCRTCQVLCKETYDLPLNNLYRRVLNYQGGSWTQNENGTYEPQGMFGYFISMSCNHCTNPACVAQCPTGAMHKDPDTGIVTTDHNRCIGCRSCQMACPYHAPAYNEEKRYMTKCDMCAAELGAGQTPLCVRGCRDRALDFGTIEEMRAKYGSGVIETAPLPKDTTQPNYILIPPKDAKPTGSKDGRLMDLDEELDFSARAWDSEEG